MSDGFTIFSIRGSCKQPVVVLAFFWLLGFLFGVFYADYNTVVIQPLMHSSAFVSPRLQDLLFVVFFPYFIATAIFLIGKPFLCVVLLLCKGFTLGFCIYSFLTAFQSAGWLLCIFHLFSDFVMLLPLFYVCLSSFMPQIRYRTAGVLYFSLASITITIDLFLVSPFMQMLITMSKRS